MKKRRCIAVLLSLLISAQTVVSCYGEEADKTDNITIEKNDENKDVENVESRNYGALQSDIADNVPYYESEVEAYSDLPESYQLDKTQYPDVRNQGSYGTCWAFAALGLSEYDLINKGLADKNIDLSELQLAYYTYNSVLDPLGGTKGDQSKYYNGSTSYSYLDRGGMYEYAVRRLSQWCGAVNENDVPYNVQNINSVLNQGLSDEYAYSKDIAHLENAYVMSLKNNTDGVKRAIMNNGAVGVQYYHSYNCLSWNSEKQLWTYYDPSITGGGHNVMIVGWDDNFSKDNFVGEKPENNGAWLIRNSWGFTQSYFWMSYENHSLLDAAWAFDMNKADNYDNNYQLDGGIDSYNVTQNICSYKTYSNVFTVPDKETVTSETLKAVSLSFTRVADVNYKIEIYTDLKNSNPYSGTKQEAATIEGTTAYAGFYTIPLEQTIQLKPGSSFSVVVTTDKYALDYEQGVNWESNGIKVWDAPVSLANGKSFYGTNAYQWNWPYGNFCIKAFTSNNVETKHSINYELNGGTNNSENQETYTSGNDAIVLKNPTREGCTFEGWYTDKDYTNKITEIPANAAQDYTLYAKWSSVTGEKLAGYNLNLDGTIGVNFFVELPNNVVVSKDAYMEFTLPNGDKSQVSVKKAKRSGSYYIFTARVKAQEMTKDIKAKMVVGNQSGKVYTYSVKQYADYILNHTDAYTEAGVKVVKGLLNYGAATQRLFSYNLDNLANESMSDSDKLIEDVDFSQYKYSVINDPDVTGIKYYGSLLNLNTSTNVKNYFRLDGDHSIDEYHFSYKIGNEEKEVAPVLSEQQGVQCYLIEIKDVKAYNLDQQPVVIIRMKNNEETDGMQLIYGAFSYAEAVSRLSTPNENLVNLTKALYWYWYGARLYADEQNK